MSWGHPVGVESARKFLPPRPCAARHRGLNIAQPEGTTHHPGGNSRSRAGPGDRTGEGGTTRAAGGRTGGRGQLARAGAGHGAASRRTTDGRQRGRRRRGNPDSPEAEVTGSGTRRQRATGQGSRKAGRQRSPGPPGRARRKAQPAGGSTRFEQGTPQGAAGTGRRTRSAGHPQGKPEGRVRAGPEGQDRVARRGLGHRNRREAPSISYMEGASSHVRPGKYPDPGATRPVSHRVSVNNAA